MSHVHDASPYLNSAEQRLLGPLVRRLLATDNPRLQRAIEEKGLPASVRMACVNATRLYAVVAFVLGVCLRVGGFTPGADALYALAAVWMAWSFWELYTVHRAEREHAVARASRRRGSSTRRQAPKLPAAFVAVCTALRPSRARKQAGTSPPAGW